MGSADREYTGSGTRPIGHLSPVLTALLVANVAIYLLDILLFDGRLRDAGMFNVTSAVAEWQFWKFFSFQFLHGSLGHLVFNCIGLYMFGAFVERWWGSPRFLWFYLICGVSGAAFFTLLVLTGWFHDGNMVGASAGIYGILIATAVIAPHARVQLLFPPVNLSMRQLAIGVIALAIFFILTDLNRNAGGEAAHLGGAIVGFLLMRFPRLLGVGSRAAFQTPRRPAGPPKLRPRTEIDLATSSEIDRILDKVSRDGLHSLTETERATLQRAANKEDGS